MERHPMVAMLRARWGVEVILAPVAEHLDGAVLVRETFEAAPGQFLFRLPRLGRVLVEAGQRMVLETVGDVDLDNWDALLAGAPLAALLAQRGLLALHGSTVEIRGRAVVVVGMSGAGKSTTAAALVARGHRLVADDVSPVVVRDSGLVVEPARPELWLFPDSIDRLGAEVQGGERVRPGIRKRRVDVPMTGEPSPLQSVVELTTGGPAVLRQGPLDLPACMQVVVRSTLAASFLAAAGMASEHLVWVQRLAAATTFHRVDRPVAGWTAEEVADIVESLHSS